MRNIHGSALLFSMCILSFGVYYYVKKTKNKDYERRYAGVLKDIERQKKKLEKWKIDNL